MSSNLRIIIGALVMVAICAVTLGLAMSSSVSHQETPGIIKIQNS